MSAVAQVEAVGSLRERAQMASAAAQAAYEEQERVREAAHREALVARLKERVAGALGIAVEDAEIVRVGSTSVVASLDGVLIEWAADEHGYARRGSLAVLRRCDRCGQETVPLDFHDLASLGGQLGALGPHRHRWDCIEREELEPESRPVPAPTTEERLIAVLRDFVQEHASV